MGELINTNCPNCGAAIQVNPDYPNKMFCQYCGTSFMVKDVINNFTTINNYNDMSFSTTEGILGRRKAILDEIKKEKDYFAEKELVYNAVIRLESTEIPSKEAQKRNKISSISWMNIIGILLIVICAILSFVFFDLGIRKVIPFISILFSNLGIVGGIVLVILHANQKKKIEARFLEEINELKEIQNKNYDELKMYYDAYGTCLIGFEYTFPQKIMAIYDMIESGKAENPKEAINLLEESNNSVEAYADKLLDKYKLSDWNTMLKEYCNNTGFDLPKGAAILRERAKLKHLM